MDICKNTDKEIWRQRPGDFYSPSIHITKENNIGINVGGHVIVASVKIWHECGKKIHRINETTPRWRWKLAMWILRHNEPIKIK